MILVFEGGNGCGKTTQLNLLEAHLRARGAATRRVKARLAPLVAPVFDELRAREPATVQELMLAAGLYQVLGAAPPDETLLADRWSYNRIARAVVSGADGDWVRGVYDRLPRPAHVLLFTLPAARAAERILRERALTPQEAGAASFPGVDLATSFVRFQTELTRLVLDEVTRAGVPCSVIDASASVEDVHREVLRRLDGLVPR
jgi:thymidylate kinase